jgi:trans-aconitate 2-methyltransferase
LTRDWDAATYDRVSEPQVEWARKVLGRLPLRGDETVLDAGCGSGRVTRLLLERLPAGHVVAVDSAPSMVEHAREALRERATVFQASLTELELEEPVDAVFSNAVFHWIADHERLFGRLFAALRPGGRLVAQCGGAGNVERFHRAADAVSSEPPYAHYLAGWRGPWNFAGADETAVRLRDVGFVDVDTWLEPRPVTPPDPSNYLRTVCLGHHLATLPEELHDGYVEAVRDRCGGELDYVRLNIDARRPSPSVPAGGLRGPNTVEQQTHGEGHEPE